MDRRPKRVRPVRIREPRETLPLMRKNNESNTMVLDLRDRRFGSLIARSRVPRGDTGNYWWYCECDCGKTHYTTTDRLRSGHTRSCGCIIKITKPAVAPYRDEVIRIFTDPDKPTTLTISQIAVSLGITKNMAIGVLDRAGLIGFQRPSRPKSTRPPIIFPGEHHCKYAYGDPGDNDFHFCGVPVDSGSYCPVHYPMLHRAPNSQEASLAA